VTFTNTLTYYAPESYKTWSTHGFVQGTLTEGEV